MKESSIKDVPKQKRNLKVIGIIIAMIGIAIILYILFMSYGSNTRSDDASLNKINQESQENPVVLYFWSNGCYYCNQQEPIINDLEKDYKPSNVTFYWFDSAKNKDLTNHYDIYGYPTTLVLDKNGIVQKFVGYSDYSEISSGINEAIVTYN